MTRNQALPPATNKIRPPPIRPRRRLRTQQNCHPACPACPGLPWSLPWDRSNLSRRAVEA